VKLPPSPFKGLAYFGDSETDWLFFFGRERESELVAANLMASRLTVLYGPSGVGKSSLLRAGVTRRLRSLVPSVDGLGGGAEIVIVDSWRDDPIAAIAAAAGARTDIPLADALSERAAAAGGELYLVLDQMEEYMLYHGRDGGPLAAELEDVLTRTEVPVHVLLGVRDDALADLDVLKRRVPGLFGNVLRLDHLTRAAARSAIEGPLRAFAELGGPEVTAEDELIEAVLDEVAAGRIERHLTGRGLVEESERGRRVEAPYLQLVLERLWDVERRRGSERLRAATLSELGGAERIVEEHLERALEGLDEDERDLVARLFNHLVTPSGTKIAHAVDDLARYARVDAARLEHVLGALEAARILRRVPGRSGGPPRYEIFHDVLAPAVLAWRSRRELESERATARRRNRRLAFVAVLALVALAGTLALAAWALTQRAEAHKQADTALSRELTALALTELDHDPELSLALATEASRVNSSRRVETVLVRALAASRVRAVLTAPGPVEALQIASNHVVAGVQGGLYVADERLRQGTKIDLDRTLLGVSGDDVLVSGPAGLELRSVPGGTLVRRLPLRPGTVVPVRDVETGIVTGEVRLPTRFRLAALGPRGTLVAVSDGSRRTVVVNAQTGDARYVLEQPSAVTALAWGPGARILASGGEDGSARLWRLSTGRPFAVLGGHRSLVTSIAFSPRATIVATASRDGTARVWKIGSITPVTVLAGHTNPLRDVAFSPNGVLVATASTDRTAEVRTAATGAIAAVLAGHSETVTGVRFVGNDHVVTASADGTLRRWNVEGAPLLRLVRHLSERVARVSFAGHDRFEAVTEDGRRLVLAPDGAVLERGRAEQPAPPRAPDGTTASIEASVVVLHRPGGGQVKLAGHTLAVTAVRFSPDGTRAVTASRDADARVWDTRTGASLHTLRGHFGTVSDAAFSPDGRWIVTAGPQRAALWDAASGARLFFLRGHTNVVTSVAFDATGRRIVTGGREGDVRTYRCDICTSGAELLRTAEARLALTGRKLTPAERAEYLTER
jgi:WD40 repeat protein